jgi:cell fate regulator YaaT (PSP1 superfamily)
MEPFDNPELTETPKLRDLSEEKKEPAQVHEGGVFLVITNGSLRLHKYIHTDNVDIVKRGNVMVFEDNYGSDWGIAHSYTTEDFQFDEEEEPGGRFVRIATIDDFLQIEELRETERTSLATCSERIKAHELPMKLLSCDYRFDRSKVTFHFSAENRVDFRILVRDLASIFKCRIELHQVGVRDETRIFGGIGFCGRRLCCMTHLSKFDPISIKMARTQNLPLTPTKISGVCGRLLCCLNYEYPTYLALTEGLPNVEDSKSIDGKMAKVLMINPLKGEVIVQFEDGKREKLTKEEYEKGIKRQDNNS